MAGWSTRALQVRTAGAQGARVHVVHIRTSGTSAHAACMRVHIRAWRGMRQAAAALWGALFDGYRVPCAISAGRYCKLVQH